jgi:hypothetical protein
MSQQEMKRKKDLVRVIAVSLGVSGVSIVAIQLLSLFISDHPDHPVNRWLVALPGIASAGVAVLAMRSIRRMDELERKIHTEAMAFGFLCSILIVATFTFLNVAGHETFPVHWLVMGMMLSWVLGLIIAAVRYR